MRLVAGSARVGGSARGVVSARHGVRSVVHCSLLPSGTTPSARAMRRPFATSALVLKLGRHEAAEASCNDGSRGRNLAEVESM